MQIQNIKFLNFCIINKHGGIMNIILIICLTILTILPLSSTYIESDVWGQVTAGQYNVGYKHIETIDYSRTYQKQDNSIVHRPMQVNIWYPAENTSGEKMRFIDYQYISKFETDFAYSNSKENFIKELKEKYIRARVSEENFDKVFLRRSLAVEKAKAISEAFPVVIYSPGGNEIATENFLMCELLASHGFLVISSPSAGFSAREVEFDNLGLRTNINDISYLYGYLNNLENANNEEVLVIGFCLGGFANVMFAQENLAVKGMIGLHNEYTNPQSLEEQHQPLRPDFAVRNLKYLEIDGPFLANRTSDFYNNLIYSERHQIRFKDIPHNAFTSQYVLQAHCFAENQIRNRKGRDLAYELTLELVLAFCNDCLKEKDNFQSAKEKILSNNNIPADFILANNSDLGLELPPTKIEFMKLLVENIDEAKQELVKTKENGSELSYFKERDLNLLAYKNLQMGNKEIALDIFKLICEYFPQSWNAWDSLGEGYRHLGNKDKAIAAYQKALELKGDDERIKEIIEELK